MNDVERYEVAEKIAEMYRDTDGVFSEEIAKETFGDLEPSEEDQVLIFKIAKDLIQHEKDIRNEDSNESDAYSEENTKTYFDDLRANSEGSTSDEVAKSEEVV